MVWAAMFGAKDPKDGILSTKILKNLLKDFPWPQLRSCVQVDLQSFGNRILESQKKLWHSISSDLLDMCFDDSEYKHTFRILV